MGAEEIIKMKCPDDDCKKVNEVKEALWTGGEHKDGMRGDIKRLRQCLAKKVSGKSLGYGILAVLGVIAICVLAGITAFGDVKKEVIINTTNMKNYAVQLEKIDKRFDIFEARQEAFKNDIIKEIRRSQ